MDKLPWIDSLSTFIHHKKPHKFCFVGLKCQKCRDLRAFLGVKSGLLILVHVKDLTFSNLEKNQILLRILSKKSPLKEPGRRRRSRSLRGKTWGEEARQAGRAVSDSFEETTTSAQDPATFERWTWGWWWSRILIQDVSTFDFFQQPWRSPLVWSQWNWGCSIWEQSPGFLKIKLMVSFWQIEEEEQQWNRYLSIYDRSMKNFLSPLILIYCWQKMATISNHCANSTSKALYSIQRIVYSV